MNWETLKTYDDLDPLIERWSDFPNFFQPVSSLVYEFENKDGDLESKTFTIYKIPKGKILYHATSQEKKMKEWNWLSFFSPHRKVSEMILSFPTKGWYNIEDKKKKVNVISDPLLYTLRLKRDLLVLYNENMGFGPNYGQSSPFFKEQGMGSFCKVAQENFLDGFVDLRDACPLFPVLRVQKDWSVKKIQNYQKKLSLYTFASDFLRLGSHVRNDPVYSFEIILCNPSKVLEIVKKEVLDGQHLLKNWLHQAKEWIQLRVNKNISVLDEQTSMKWKYDYMLQSNEIPAIQRFYHGGYIRIKDTTYNQIYMLSRNNPQDFPNPPPPDVMDIVFDENQKKNIHPESVLRFWLRFWEQSKQNQSVIHLFEQHVLPFLKKLDTRLAAWLLLCMCQKISTAPTKANLKILFKVLK